MVEKPEVFVQRSGVVRLKQGTYAEITVNGIDLIAEVYGQVFDNIKPATDVDRNFDAVALSILMNKTEGTPTSLKL